MPVSWVPVSSTEVCPSPAAGSCGLGGGGPLGPLGGQGLGGGPGGPGGGCGWTVASKRGGGGLIKRKRKWKMKWKLGLSRGFQSL